MDNTVDMQYGYRVRALRPEPPLKLLIVFEPGGARLVDLAAVSDGETALARLRDPEYFARCEIAEDGRAVAWPGGLDFCADALYAQSDPVSLPRSGGGHCLLPEAADEL